jgi:putative colanic acid biosynthesis UDP-glucose lipid carrier transferase
MAHIPGSTGSFTTDELVVPLIESSAPGRVSSLDPPSISRQHKSVRIGSHEPAGLALIRRGISPFVVMVMLANCLLIAGARINLQFCALALISFFVSALILTPPPAHPWTATGERARRSASRMLIEWSCVALVLAFVSVAFKLPQTFSREVLLGWLLATPVALLLADSLAPLAERIVTGGSAEERHVIVGANEVGIELARRIARSPGSGKSFGFLDFRGTDRVPAGLDQPVESNCTVSELAAFVRRNSITRVYLALPIATTPRVHELIKELRDTTASIYFVPNIFAFDLLQARSVDINGMPVLSICDSPFHGVSACWKRAFDLCLAVVVLLLAWPALLLLGLAIRVTSRGPVIFKQRRYGLNGEEILVYKFRSMTVCEDGPVVAQAQQRDQRVTPLGAFLRKTSFDELPQILNVLEGTMSFVGPRPHAVAHNEEYRKVISGYMIRHKVRPGITGWAQIHGLRGETRTVDKMQKRVQYDLHYLEHWSLALDVKIIFKTALLVLRDRNAF